ncbi:hypothetical protein HRbin17_02582 [bacterium HR17]|jgi:PST family polysaccharide transporter|uniref:Polysaccharide biosynthesis protein C-terminal domain-containing protein n=1 Tax=Candidatus Fervidibacter japonicus TaxID=2035412 RepID=A0A2H5XFX1_9BACT|nr:hypothetical protein HRbin17_02582 [bacterium HR17]
MISEIIERLTAEVRFVLRHRLTVGAGHLIAAQYVAAALNILTNIMMARFLGPTDYGLTALVVAFPTILWSFVGIKSVSVITRYVAGFRATSDLERLKDVVKLGYILDIGLSLLALTLVAVSAWWVAGHFYGRSSLAWLMVAYAASFPFFSFSGGSYAVLSSWEHWRLLAVFEILYPLIKLCLVAGFILLGWGVTGAVVGMAVAQAVIGITMVITATYLLLQDGIGPWWRASWGAMDEIKDELVKFFGWNYLLVTLSGLVSQIPLMLLGGLRGPEEAGFYRLAMNITTVASYAKSSLGRVTYPILSARWAAGDRNMNFVSLNRWTLRAGVPLCMVFVLSTPLLPFLIPLLFGNAFRPAVLPTQIMMVGQVVSALFFWLNPFYFASGRIGTWVKGYSLYTAAIILAGTFAASHWGVVGLALLVASAEVTFSAGMLALVPRYQTHQGGHR